MTVDMEAELYKPFPQDNSGYRPVEVTLKHKDTTKTRITRREAVLLIDTSTSMDPDKIVMARKGVRKVLDTLNPDDRIAILGYDSSVTTVEPMTEWGELEQEKVYENVVGSDAEEYDGVLDATGVTDIPNALESAWAEFSTEAKEDVVSKNILLLSDGKDSKEGDVYETLANNIAEDGISIIAGGIGRRYNEDVMRTLAHESGGAAYHLEGDDDIAEFLEEQIEIAAKELATEPVLEIDLEDGFYLDLDEPVVFTKPEKRKYMLEGERSEEQIELPRLTTEHEQQLSFVVVATRSRGIPRKPMLTLTLTDGIDGRTLATTEVEAVYEQVDKQPNEGMKKRRKTGKIIADMSDSDIDKSNIKRAINEVEEEGWSGAADDLKRRLTERDKPGGHLKVTKRRVENTEDE